MFKMEKKGKKTLRYAWFKEGVIATSNVLEAPKQHGCLLIQKKRSTRK